MAPQTRPELSVVLVRATEEQAGASLACLGLRAREAAIELVIVHPSGGATDPGDERLRPFAAVRFVEADVWRSMAAARTAGLEAATAPVVAFTEPHAYPRPGWARAIVDAHRGPWAAVGPQIECGNPRGPSEAVLVMDYGEWLAPAERREAEHLPGHNSSYKMTALRSLDGDLAPLLEAETVLHWRLRERGERLLLEPAAGVAHRNYLGTLDLLRERYLVGRIFAATRAHEWGRGRRLAAALLTPALPPLVLARKLRAAARSGRLGHVLRNPATLPAMICGQAFGEALGYLRGIGSAAARLAPYEYDQRAGSHPRPPAAPAR